MSYAVQLLSHDLSIKKPEELFAFLKVKGLYYDLPNAFNKYTLCQLFVDNDDYRLEFFEGCFYYDDVWKELAPFLDGTMEWLREDGKAWKDIFHNCTLTKSFGQICYPDELLKQNTINLLVPTICGLKGYPMIDRSMESVYGVVPTGQILLEEPVEIIKDGTSWWCYRVDVNKKYAHIRDAKEHGILTSMIPLTKFMNLYRNQKEDN